MEFHNTPKLTDEVTTALRTQCAKRACTMALILDEANAAGARGVEYTRRAVYKYGQFGGQDIRKKMKNPDDLEEFAEYFGVGLDANIYEMERLVWDEKRLYIDFHYCPYVAEWLKIGREHKEIGELCEIAMEGDRAIEDTFAAFRFTLGKTIAKGDRVCQIRFDKT
ncbi:MAG: L-2-amino-thiazoline-4-carboxylic acid hydrolase [Spirochaetaceae bacterium]|nr:L-2-amino-thiazoline-4-carboxylic acid hydrolase [Spirochaetaceae bacterium]